MPYEDEMEGLLLVVRMQLNMHLKQLLSVVQKALDLLDKEDLRWYY